MFAVFAVMLKVNAAKLTGLCLGTMLLTGLGFDLKT